MREDASTISGTERTMAVDFADLRRAVDSLPRRKGREPGFFRLEELPDTPAFRGESLDGIRKKVRALIVAGRVETGRQFYKSPMQDAAHRVTMYRLVGKKGKGK